MYYRIGYISEGIRLVFHILRCRRGIVVLSFKDERPDPKAKGKKYTTTWFDMLRIENGKIAEHWDSALKE
ncbi:hypothetical protein [Mucilaginibacter sp. OK283]|jgi:predicted SnoaL-like aldol condensation-catalyzing enzyme|uniref:hypothetical protein n=1 Tax=Mucilaginibacter sp. OK283 TaxID=1881049 RepID=UPI0008C5AD8E|nr:hypothetical protein [Mucilaginibacter sp. OK283]SEP05970.1 hypothetical protein SAMN05428947_106173 [Mucilaginibacter sp. OK283]